MSSLADPKTRNQKSNPKNRNLREQTDPKTGTSQTSNPKSQRVPRRSGGRASRDPKTRKQNPNPNDSPHTPPGPRAEIPKPKSKTQIPTLLPTLHRDFEQRSQNQKAKPKSQRLSQHTCGSVSTHPKTRKQKAVPDSIPGELSSTPQRDRNLRVSSLSIPLRAWELRRSQEINMADPYTKHEISITLLRW